MLGRLQTRDAQLLAIERVKAWTRERFGLRGDAPVFVSEAACSLPGCPPLETVVGFWTDDTTRHHFKVFKPLNDVGNEDIPPAWLRDALKVEPGAECSC